MKTAEGSRIGECLLPARKLRRRSGSASARFCGGERIGELGENEDENGVAFFFGSLRLVLEETNL